MFEKRQSGEIMRVLRAMIGSVGEVIRTPNVACKYML
jgi:hypothetical protein